MSKSLSSRIPLLFLFSFLLVLVIYLQWPEQQKVKTKHQRIISVKTTTVKKAEFKDVIQALGTTRANEQVFITTKYSDLVEVVSFNDGQKVKKGDVLVRLNNQEATAKVKELQANLEESVAQLNRFQDLLSKKATSRSLVDEQEAKTKAISAQLFSAKAKLASLTIKAPFEGVLGFRQISVGAFINVGDVITSLDDLSKIKVDFFVPERFLTAVKIKQVIRATSTAYGNKKFIGKISSVDSRIDPITRALQVRAIIDNKNDELRPGMLLNIEVERQVDTILQLPESAIIPIEDKHFIFVIENNQQADVEQKVAKRIAITIGRRHPGIVEVTGGVDEGTEVVIEGALKLRDGGFVNVLQEK
jgi:membrane fusion protein (multidrug efflux system)